VTERGNKAAKASPVSVSASVAVKVFEPTIMLIGVCAIRVIVLIAKISVTKRLIISLIEIECKISTFPRHAQTQIAQITTKNAENTEKYHF
jgi:hypothetical protein